MFYANNIGLLTIIDPPQLFIGRYVNFIHLQLRFLLFNFNDYFSSLQMSSSMFCCIFSKQFIWNLQSDSYRYTSWSVFRFAECVFFWLHCFDVMWKGTPNSASQLTAIFPFSSLNRIYKTFSLYQHINVLSLEVVHNYSSPWMLLIVRVLVPVHAVEAMV